MAEDTRGIRLIVEAQLSQVSHLQASLVGANKTIASLRNDLAKTEDIAKTLAKSLAEAEAAITNIEAKVEVLERPKLEPDPKDPSDVKDPANV